MRLPVYISTTLPNASKRLTELIEALEGEEYVTEVIKERVASEDDLVEAAVTEKAKKAFRIILFVTVTGSAVVDVAENWSKIYNTGKQVGLEIKMKVEEEIVEVKNRKHLENLIVFLDKKGELAARRLSQLISRCENNSKESDEQAEEELEAWSVVYIST